MTGVLRLIVADDHSLFRAGLVELLATVTGFEVVADVGTGDAVIAVAATLSPDVILLDVHMPGPPPVEVVRVIRAATPRAQVVVVTMQDDLRVMQQLFAAGASAYLLKTSDRDVLTAAIKLAARGDETVLVSAPRAALLALTNGPAPSEAVSARERDVLLALDQGQSNRQIAAALHVSEATVKRHLSNIYLKLEVNSRGQAVSAARARGIITE